jgi:hypothetical protein
METNKQTNKQPLLGELLTPFTSIRELSGSNLGQKTDYTGTYRGFPQSLNDNAWLLPVTAIRQPSSVSSPVNHSISTNHSTLYGMNY